MPRLLHEQALPLSEHSSQAGVQTTALTPRPRRFILLYLPPESVKESTEGQRVTILEGLCCHSQQVMFYPTRLLTDGQ